MVSTYRYWTESSSYDTKEDGLCYPNDVEPIPAFHFEEDAGKEYRDEHHDWHRRCETQEVRSADKNVWFGYL